MAKFNLTDPPILESKAKYPDYKDWLLQNFYNHLCSFCLTQHGSIEIEHYEPQSYAPDKTHDPNNLLTACRNCNGPSGKSDYHPNYIERRRLKKDKTGFLVLDIRNESFGDLYEIDKDTGKLLVKQGKQAERAIWNAVTILKLDLDFVNKCRAKVLEKLEICEKLLVELDRNESDVNHANMERCFSIIVDDLAQQRLLLFAFDIFISPKLSEKIEHSIYNR